MLFADSHLAARIDRAEAHLCADLARAASTDTVVRPLAGGLAICAKRGSPVNKVIGVGFGEVLRDDHLDAVEDEWRAREEPVRIELSVLADAENGTILTRRGYRLIGFEHELGRSLVDQPPVGHGFSRAGSDVGQGWSGPDVGQGFSRAGSDVGQGSSGSHVGQGFSGSHVGQGFSGSHVGQGFSPALEGLTIERVTDDLIPVWRNVVVDGFFHLDGTGTGSDDSFTREALDHIMGDFVRAPGMDKFLVRIHGEPVGAASMRLDDGIAQLSGATTLPAFRKRGVQTALLHHRLRFAREFGCTLAVVTTQPGSRSQANTQRQGFELLYARAILVKGWTGDAFP